MIIKSIKEFNQLFVDELNNTPMMVNYLGEITEKEVNLMHRAFHLRIVRYIYSHFPARLDFGHYFHIFSKLKGGHKYYTHWGNPLKTL